MQHRPFTVIPSAAKNPYPFVIANQSAHWCGNLQTLAFTVILSVAKNPHLKNSRSIVGDCHVASLLAMTPLGKQSDKLEFVKKFWYCSNFWNSTKIL